MKTFFIFLCIGILSRLMIHLPDATPLVTLSLLAPMYFSKRNAFFVIFLTLLFSDLTLHFIQHTPAFGTWSLFTYSGWCIVVLMGLLLKKYFSVSHAIIFSIIGTLLFWIWTNFGVWLSTHTYSHDAPGLMTCYLAAVPFLRNNILSTAISMGCFFAFPQTISSMKRELH